MKIRKFFTHSFIYSLSLSLFARIFHNVLCVDRARGHIYQRQMVKTVHFRYLCIVSSFDKILFPLTLFNDRRSSIGACVSFPHFFFVQLFLFCIKTSRNFNRISIFHCNNCAAFMDLF